VSELIFGEIGNFGNGAAAANFAKKLIIFPSETSNSDNDSANFSPNLPLIVTY
jgi:hypothetical protein